MISITNPRLTEAQIADLVYIKGLIDDVLTGTPDDTDADIQVLENISDRCSYLAGELFGI